MPQRMVRNQTLPIRMKLVAKRPKKRRKSLNKTSKNKSKIPKRGKKVSSAVVERTKSKRIVQNQRNTKIRKLVKC